MQHLQPNTTLQGGKYRIERVLGQGGFGITYLARQTSLGGKVAIKELFINGLNDRNGETTKVEVSSPANTVTFKQQKEKFKKEAKRLFDINNKHVVRVFDFFEENNTAYYVMEYIPGKSLADAIRLSSKDEQTALNYLDQILNALSVIHEKRIWHLDIKPANILVNGSNLVLIDFGASKHIDTNNILTTSSVIAFTQNFAAPEQYQGDMKKFGPWTDFYALGATLYQMLTLHTPPSFSDIFNYGNNAFSSPSYISERTKNLVIWMMNPNMTKRPQSVSALKQELRRTEYITPLRPNPQKHQVFSPTISLVIGILSIIPALIIARLSAIGYLSDSTQLVLSLVIVVPSIFACVFFYNEMVNGKV